MELRSQKTSLCLIAFAFAVPLAAQHFELPARLHGLPRSHPGTLRLTADGVAFDDARRRTAALEIAWIDVQDLSLTDAGSVRVTTYQDRRLLLGKDQSYLFTLAGKPDMLPIYLAFRDKLGPRLTARLADAAGTPQWSLLAKHLTRPQGSQGVLHVFDSKIVYAATRPAQSRTWRMADLPNISTADPCQFSIGAEQFQLKEPLDPARYEALWLRLNRPKGLELISTKTEPQP